MSLALLGLIGLTSACHRDLDMPVADRLGGHCNEDLLADVDRRDIRAAKDLVRRGANLRCAEMSGRLRNAIVEDHIGELAALLDIGFDPNVPGDEFGTSISMSLAFDAREFRNRSLASTRLLLQHGVNPNQLSDFKWNPRHERADDTGAPFVRYEVDLHGATPLIAATVAGDLDLVKLLLEYGADSSVRDEAGMTAMDYAERTYATDISVELARHTRQRHSQPATTR
jgi:ankyrin repeat protein